MPRKQWFSVDKRQLDQISRALPTAKTVISEFKPEDQTFSPIEEHVLLAARPIQSLQRIGIQVATGRSGFSGITMVGLALPEGGKEAPSEPAPPPEEEPKIPKGVTIGDDWDGEFRSAAFADLVAKILTPVIKKPIRVSVPHARAHLPYLPATRGFSIWIWSAPPGGMGTIIHPPKMWGIDTPCTDTSPELGYPTEGFLPVDSPEGDTIGCLNENNLYIFFDVVHRSGARVASVIELLLKEVARLYPEASKPVESSSLFKQSCKQYALLCSTRAVEDKKDCLSKLSKLKEQMEENRAEMIRLSRAMVECQNVIEGDAVDVDPKKLEAEWEALLRVPKVAEAFCTKNLLAVKTDTIYVQHSKTKQWHKIGKFNISIGLAPGAEHFIRMVNIDGMRDHRGMGSMNHPHVFSDGHACFGTVEQSIRQLIQKRELAALIQLLIAFLSHANVADEAGRSLANWPKVSEKEATQPRKEKKNAA